MEASARPSSASWSFSWCTTLPVPLPLRRRRRQRRRRRRRRQQLLPCRAPRRISSVTWKKGSGHGSLGAIVILLGRLFWVDLLTWFAWVFATFSPIFRCLDLVVLAFPPRPTGGASLFWRGCLLQPGMASLAMANFLIYGLKSALICWLAFYVPWGHGAMGTSENPSDHPNTNGK